MRDLNELQQQRAALVAEQEELTARLPELDAARLAAPSGWNHLGNPTGSPELTAARNAQSDAESRIHSITGTIARLDQQIAHTALVAGADDTIAKARAEGKTATDQSARLTTSHELVRERLTSLQDGTRQAKEAAQLSEQSAAKAIASATASGNSKAEKEAQQLMAEAIEAGRQAEAKERQNQAVVSALEAEAEALSTQLASAQQRADAAKQAVQNAERLKLREEWNKTVEALTVAGVHLVEAGERFGGFAGRSTLDVPTFGPIARALNAGEIERRVKEKAA